MSLSRRVAAGLLLAASATSVTAGVASAAPQGDPHSHNVFPTVPGVSELPVPTGTALFADQVSQDLSDIIYAGR